MKYLGSGNNIYSSDIVDPEFLKHLYSYPIEFIEELYIVWSNRNKPKITDKEIKDLYKALSNKGFDIKEVFKNGL